MNKSHYLHYLMIVNGGYFESSDQRADCLGRNTYLKVLLNNNVYIFDIFGIKKFGSSSGVISWEREELIDGEPSRFLGINTTESSEEKALIDLKMWCVLKSFYINQHFKMV